MLFFLGELIVVSTSRCLLLIVLSFAASSTSAQEVVVSRDVVYGTGGGVDLHLDIAVPPKKTVPKGQADAPDPLPCIVVIHGGAWRQGSKSSHIEEIKRFAQAGFVSATVEYRFAPQFQFPAQVEDVKCAVRYLRAHADEYGIDPSRIGAIGFSAGAHLSMMLGVMDANDGFHGDGGWADQSDKVQAVVSYFGPTLFTANNMPERTDPLVRDFLGGSFAEVPDAYRDASPLTFVNQGDAPMLLFQGTNDPLVPYTQAIEMATAMTKADVPGRVELLIDAGHGWGGIDRDRTGEDTFNFFARYLSSPNN